MQDIKFTIEEYKASHEGIKNRIQELNLQISERGRSQNDSVLKQMQERRSTMYIQLWDIEYAIRELSEYLMLQGAKQGSERKIG